MMRPVAFVAVVFFSTLCLAAPKDDLLAAARNLAQAENYTWVSAAASGGHPLMGGPTEGRTQKSAYTTLSLSRNSGICIVFKGPKAVLRAPAGWLTPQQVQNLPERDRNYVALLTYTIASFKAPPAAVEEFLARSTNLHQQADGSYTAQLTEAAARDLATPMPQARRQTPQVINPTGTVSFWINDGRISKYEYSITARLKTDRDERDFDRVITTTIKDVGSTFVTVPEEAMKQLN